MNVLILTPGIQKKASVQGFPAHSPDAVFLTHPFYQKSFFENADFPVFEDDGFLPAQEGGGLDSTAKSFARQWFLEEAVAPKMVYRGIPLGSLYMRHAAYAFIGMLRAISIFQNFFKRHSVSKIYLADDGSYWSEVILWLGGQRNIPIEKRDCRHEEKIPGAGFRIKEALKRGLMLAARGISQKAPPGGVLYSSSIKYALPFFKRSARKNYFLREVLSWKAFWLGIRHHFFHLPAGNPAAPQEEDSASRHLLEDCDEYFGRTPFFMFRGENIWPVARFYLKELFEKEFRHAKNFIDSFENILPDLAPSAIVVEEDVCVFNKALVLAGHKWNIPTFVLMHGVPTMEVGSIPVSARHVLVWGESMKRRLLDWGVDPAQILEIGAPQYAGQRRLKQSRERRKICRRFFLDPRKRLVLLASAPFRTNERPDFFKTPLTPRAISQMLKTALDFAASEMEVSLIIKLHPADKIPEWTRRLIAGYPSGVRQRVRCLQHGADSLSLIAGSDLLLTLGSTVYFEALLLKTPVVTFDHPFPDRYYDFLSSEYLDLEDPAASLSRLQGLLQPGRLEGLRETQEAELEKHFYEKNRQALNFLTDLLEQKKSPWQLPAPPPAVSCY